MNRRTASSKDALLPPMASLPKAYVTEAFSVRFKLSNLLNQMSYYAHDDNSVNPIVPRQFAATFAYKS